MHSAAGEQQVAALQWRAVRAEEISMNSSGDPQIVYLAARTAAFGEQVHQGSENIRTLRRELDALWVTRQTSDGGVVWVLRQRRVEPPRRSA